MRPLILAALVGGLAAAATAAPKADEKPALKTGISGVLGTLDWGVGSLQVMQMLEGEIEARYADRLKKADTLAIDRMLKQKRDEVKAIKASLVRFDGARTGYEASIIADDFRPNAGESVLRVEDGPAQRYFFFRDEQLFKVIVVYSSAIARKMDFPRFVAQVGGKYGAPAERITGEDKALVAARWADELTALEVQNRSLYATYVMVFLDKVRGVEIEASRPPRQALGASPEVDARSESMIDDIMAEGGGASADVVDKITGVQHRVDLDIPERTYDPLRKAPDPPKARGKKPAEKAVEKTRGRPAAPAPPELPTGGGGDDVIIY